MRHAIGLILWCAVIFFGTIYAIDAMLAEDELALKRLREHIAEVRR